MAVKVDCCKCKMEFWVTDAFHKTALQMRETLTFYCPAGHPQHFVTGQSTEEKLRQERDRLAQRIAFEQDQTKEAKKQRDAAKRSAAAYKGSATRMKNRAKAGVCPCCNRTFKNLADHIATQHPDAELDKIVEFGQAS